METTINGVPYSSMDQVTVKRISNTAWQQMP